MIAGAQKGQADVHVDERGDGTPCELLAFRSGGRRCAIDIGDVREIRSWSAPTPLPHAPPHLLGLVNLRGTVLPVTDLAVLLDAGPTASDPRNVIVVAERSDRMHGLLVEAVSEIVRTQREEIKAIPTQTTEGPLGDLSRGILIGEEMTHVLDLGRILTAPGVDEVSR